MEDNAHIIQKVRADLVLNSEQNHGEKSDLLKKAIQEAMDNLSPLFDDLAGDSLIRIDSLSVKINIPMADFDQLDKAIENAVKEKIMEVFDSQKEDLGSTSNEAIQHISDEENYREILSTFLITGDLPWWAGKEVYKKAENWLMDLPADEWISFAKKLLQKNPLFIERLVRQFSPASVEKIARKTIEGQPDGESILILQHEIHQFFRSEKMSQSFIEELQKDLISGIIKSALTGLQQEKLVEGVLISVFNKVRKIYGEMKVSQQIMHELGTRLKNTGLQDEKYWDDQLELLQGEENQIQGLKDEYKPKSIEDFIKEEKDIFANKEGIEVQNSGVVILHPFLENLYKNLGFVEKGEFLNEAAMERAVCLLHYLATGDEEFPEYELQIPKFLCGWPMSLPINRHLKLADSEMKECESVLSSCLEYWEALKNTTIEGLRENFLKRDGILKREEFGWSLYIEDKTIDLLLDKLPWNLSIIKMKWVEEILTVHWR
jgi:hypothetical protein